MGITNQKTKWSIKIKNKNMKDMIENYASDRIYTYVTISR